MAKFSLIRNIYSITSLGFSKKIKLICEFAIFLILAALISSIISIYFETKLMKYNNDFIQLELEESSIQEWMTFAPENNLRNKMRQFYFKLLKDEKIRFTENKKGYYFYILTRQDDLLKDAILTVKYKLKEIENNNFTIKEQTFLKEQAKDINLWAENYIEMEDFRKSVMKNFKMYENNLSNQSLFDNVEFSAIQKHILSTEETYSNVYLFFQEYNRIIDLKKTELRKKILAASQKSSNLILYAFLLQLFIFMIIQFFELREVAGEKKNI